VGIEIWADGPALRYRGDADLLSADALDLLKRHKPAILARLYEPVDRANCLQSVNALGYPPMEIRPGETLPGHADAWETFTRWAYIPDVRLVLGKLAILELDQLEPQQSKKRP
jgi:hypothetical protein